MTLPLQQRVFLLSTDLLCVSSVRGVTGAREIRLEICSTAQDLLHKTPPGPGDLVLLDLNSRDIDTLRLVPKLREHVGTCQTDGCVSVVAFGPHVHKGKLAAALEAGCDEVLSRGQFHGQIDQLIARYLPAGE